MNTPDLRHDIQPVTAFRRKTQQFLRRLKKSKRPVVLTVNGKAEAIVQDAGAYQALLDIAARADVREAIRQGLADVAAGRTRGVREAFAGIRKAHGLPR